MKDQNIDDFEDIDPEDNLRMDNKIKRLELELKGAKFMEHNPDGIQLPPEIEAQMLDHILNFEKQKHSAVEVDIYDFIGRPKFKNLDSLKDNEILKETERVLKLMAKKGVFLTSMAEIEEREFYRFLTQEFFFKKTLDLNSPGFIRHFIYEEFYPNEVLNAEKTAEFFLQVFMHEEDIREPIKVLCREEIRDYLLNFKGLYSRFELKKLDIIESDIKKIKGHVIFDIEFEAFMENTLKSHTLSGEINVEIRRRKGFWQVSHLQFPKLV